MRVPVAVVTGAVTVCRASGPVDLMVVSVRGAFPYSLIVVFVHVQARGDPGTDTYDFGIGKRPTNLPALREIGDTANRRPLGVQRIGHDPGDHPGPEPSRCRARAAADRTGVEAETDLIGAADVEFVADDLLEEDPTRDR